MRFSRMLMVTLAAGAVAACGQDVPPPDKLDEFAWMDEMTFGPVQPVASALEAGFADSIAAEAPAPARRSTSSAARRPSGTYTRAPAPVRTETVRHTARDAAIGAAGGAVIGAVAGGSRHRVKGAIIGGAAGAVIGGVIGHTIDTEERVVRN